MKPVIYAEARYEKGETITHQGNWSSIQPYLKCGFYVKEDRNGFWVLVKPVSVPVTLTNSEGKTFCYNMKQDIIDHFGKTRISRAQYDAFCKAVKTGEAIIYMDEDGRYRLEW